MDDARNKTEAQTEEASAAQEGASGCAKTGGGNMRGAVQTLTGERVAEGDEQPAPSDARFAEDMTKARKTLKDTGAMKITVRMVTRRLRASKMGAALGASGRMDTAVGTRRYHNQRGRSVGARADPSR